jgi:hypothetical protein
MSNDHHPTGIMQMDPTAIDSILVVKSEDVATSSTNNTITTSVVSSPSVAVEAYQHINLHDCLALGAMEYGLPYLKVPSTVDVPVDQHGFDTEDGMDQDRPTTTTIQETSTNVVVVVVPTEDHVVAPTTTATAEIHCLPLLLRWLSQARPVSSLPSFNEMVPPPPQTAAEEYSSRVHGDPWLEDIVARLEDRAALYAAAESIQMVTCDLAPTVCHRIGQLSPLSLVRQHRHPHHHHRKNVVLPAAAASSLYDTTELQILAQNPLHVQPPHVGTGGGKKQRRLSLTLQHTSRNDGMDHFNLPKRDDGGGGGDGDDDDNLHGVGRSGDVSDNDSDDLDTTTTHHLAAAAGATAVAQFSSSNNNNRNKKRRRPKSSIDSRILSLSTASEDSPEYIVLKTLQELISLTVASLQQEDWLEGVLDQQNSYNETQTMEQEENDATLTNGLSLSKMDDSILAQPARSSKAVANPGGSSMNTSTFVDLASTLVSLMHYAPVLQHRHVAVGTLLCSYIVHLFLYFSFVSCHIGGNSNPFICFLSCFLTRVLFVELLFRKHRY